jgi:hypothetical protein
MSAHSATRKKSWSSFYADSARGREAAVEKLIEPTGQMVEFQQERPIGQSLIPLITEAAGIAVNNVRAEDARKMISASDLSMVR